MTNVNLDWVQFKAVVDARSLSIQYMEDTYSYRLYAFEGLLTIFCALPKDGTAAVAVADFETNYKSAGNASLQLSVGLMGQLDDVATIAAIENKSAPLRITPQRGVHTNLRNQAGTEVGTAANPLAVTSPVAVGNVSAVNKYYIDDMNAANGGVARGSAISTTYVTTYSKSGSGLLFGFSISFEGNLLGADEFIIKLTMDGTIAFEISTSDVGTAALFGFGTNGDAQTLGIQVANNNFVFKMPEQAAFRYNSTIAIAIKKVGGSTKQFRAGVVTLTKE